MRASRWPHLSMRPRSCPTVQWSTAQPMWIVWPSMDTWPCEIAQTAALLPMSRLTASRRTTFTFSSSLELANEDPPLLTSEVPVHLLQLGQPVTRPIQDLLGRDVMVGAILGVRVLHDAQAHAQLHDEVLVGQDAL